VCCDILTAVSTRDSERLQSWKEIAVFLGCDPRTAQRYERHRNLPVHRIPGGGRSQVFAFTSELQQWLLSNSPNAVDNPSPTLARPPDKLPTLPILLGVLALLAFLYSLLPSPVSLSSNPIRLTNTSGTKLPPLLTDSSYVYYQESNGNKLALKVIPVAGGTASLLPLELENPDAGVIAPNGRAMLLRSIQKNKDSDEPLYLQPLPPAAPTRLGVIRAYDSAWMPDGRNIIFSAGRSVYQALGDGSLVRKLFDVPGRAYWFRWSPDSRTLRFTVYDSQHAAYTIWETPSVDFRPFPVSFGLDKSAPQCCGTWSPGGDTYFFQAQVGGFFHVFGFNERWAVLRRSATQLTSGQSNYRSPVPLPSGDRLLVLNETQKAEVARYDPAAKRWTPLLEGIPAATAAFSPDGKTLAFTRLPDHSLWKCDLPACSSPVSLIPPPTRVSMPRWSPDGAYLSCMVRNLTGKWRAGTVIADGSGVFTPLPDPLAEADPVWSPTGDRIAFGATPNPDSGTEASIHLLNWKSLLVEAIPGSQGLHSPAWSPDGRRIAAIRADTREITLFDFVTARWTRPLPSIRAGYLNWSASGHRVFFLAGVLNKDQVVMAFDPHTGTVAPVAEFSGIRRPVFSFGDWLGLGPGDTPLALRDLSTEEILSWPINRD
jgi:Tol biopolymer transport system component